MSTSTITVGGQSVTLVSTPTTPGFRSVQFSPSDAVGIVSSVFTGQAQAQKWPGADLLSGTLTLPTLSQQQADDWISFLMQCRGMANAFLVGDPLKAAPRGSGAGSPMTDASAGVNQAGSETLSTTGWTPSAAGVLKRGDWMQAGYRMYRALDDVNADGSGNAVIPIWPTIREQVGGTITTSPTAPFVQAINGNTATTTDESGGSASGNFSLPSPTTASNTILVCIETYSPSNSFTTPTVSDGTNTYSLIGSTTSFYRTMFGSYQKSYCFMATSISGGAVSLTATVTANGYGFKIALAEYGPCSGVDTFAATNSPDGGGNPPGVSLTTTAANESLVFLSSCDIVPSTPGYVVRLAGGNNNLSLALYDSAAVDVDTYNLSLGDWGDGFAGAFLLALKMAPITTAASRGGVAVPLILTNPKGLFRLASNKRDWSADFTRRTSISIPIQEYR